MVDKTEFQEIKRFREKWAKVLDEDEAEKIILNEDDEKHIKGLLYDNLALRYIRAREHECDLETLQMFKSDISVAEKYGSLENALIKRRRHNADRDIMRFLQILNEAIGEHD